MALQFYFGASGYGKSRMLYEEMIQKSIENPKQNILIIVPDQFTMQTQMDFVKMHPSGGIMNIDVLSFGRLSHRIIEEAGGLKQPVLDDTGKCLLLRKVAANLEKDLAVIGKNLNKQGYIHEVKSMISEFMQYGISESDLEEMISYSGSRGILNYKLMDLKKLYEGFAEYKREHFITTEETLDVVREALKDSKVVKDAIVVFDGFTGFTPIQNRLIQELMVQTKDLIVSLTIPAKENPYEEVGEQDLFYLTKKTVRQLTVLAEEVEIQRKEDIFLGENLRHKGQDGLAHLEKYLFRYPMKAYEKETDEIEIYHADSMSAEIRETGLRIRELIREGYQYRDMAIVCGDLGSYAGNLERIFARLEIPCFLDSTTNIVLNPMIEFIKSALQIIHENFSYASVFRYLRSGMVDLERGDVDLLEEYVLHFGIRGRKMWSTEFNQILPKMKTDEGYLIRMNELREAFLAQMEAFMTAKKTARGYVEAVYTFLLANGVGDKLKEYEEKFKEKNQLVKAKEYGQIYTLVLKLLEQIEELLSDEEMDIKEFSDILEAGFGEIEVGSIPQNVDRVLVGDIERSRLKEIKFLFFLGVNEGNIPKSGGSGGLLSELDREFLKDTGKELAPGSREQMYIQRLYLYLNMTKPTKKLYLSYARVDAQGKSIRPAYLVDMIRKLFPNLREREENEIRQIETLADSKEFIAKGLRKYADGRMEEQERSLFGALTKVFSKEDEKAWETMVEAAFCRYESHPLAKEIAKLLYGTYLRSSVSRLETYAACEYEHFLRYGLGLKEWEEYEIESSDIGNMFHGVLEEFSKLLEQHNESFLTFSKEMGEELLKEALYTYAKVYHGNLFYNSERNEYALKRLERILLRTVNTLQEQLKKGKFKPENYEVMFQMTSQLEDVEIALSAKEKMQLQGRIDRVDTYEDEDHVYVKVIDYKSGDKQFDLVALYYGLQLQLVVYMNAALAMEQKKHKDKEVLPAALLYYQVKDPVVEDEEDLSEEMLSAKISKELRMSGVVNDDTEIIRYLDDFGEGKSTVIPVDFKKDGSFGQTSSVMSREEIEKITNFVNRKVQSIGKEILQGNIAVNPYERGMQESCTYCPYKGVCGYDEKIPGYHKRKIRDLGKEEIWQKMEADNGI